MNKIDAFWARLATFGALFFMLWAYLSSTSAWVPWVSGLAASFFATLGTIVVDYWLRLFLQRKIEAKNNFKPDQRNAESSVFTLVTINSLRKLLQVHTEKEILETVLGAGVDLLGVSGSSFVPYDEWGQSLPALIHGKVPEVELQSWTQRLSLPETRQVCKNCKLLHGDSECVLLSTSAVGPAKVRCFPLNSAGREVGVLNFYCDNNVIRNLESEKIIIEIIDAAGQALENLRTRDQEIAALLYLQNISSPKSDLSILLNTLLENVQRALDVDFSILYLPGGVPGRINSHPQFFSKTKDDINPESSIPGLSFLEGIWSSVLTSGHSLSLENVVINKSERWKVLLAVPLVWHGEDPVGVLVLGSNSNQAFTQRHQALLETLAGQAALLIQNAKLIVQVEYQAVVEERTRLAREIHDGLAQTLAFLKIQATQMQNFFTRGESEKLSNSLQANYRTLSDAYIDARQAIDNLRRVPTTNLRDWIAQVASDFEMSTSQKVNISVADFFLEYPANIQAQLIRIVQEALSNVRKHAAANVVNILGFQDGDCYVIEIRDNGIGFDPDGGNVEMNSRYGLRGMRERSDSIGADFQIISQPGKGTCVSLRMQVSVKEDI